MPYTIKSFKASNGERFSQIYDDSEGGFPLFYPTAFIARSKRLSTSHETQKVYLEAIKRVCEWEVRSNIDLTVRFQRREFLSTAEIDGLATYLQTARRGKPGDTIGRTKSNTYVAYAAQYFKWLAEDVITNPNTADIRAAITAQDETLTAKVIRKSGSRAARDQRILAKKLPDDARVQLESLFENPFQKIYRDSDHGPRLRNISMLRVLYATGMRRGELLSLKLGNFQESSGGENANLIIERNHHDDFDSRVRQPVAKTLGRIVPIPVQTENQILEYISKWRAEVPGVGFSDNDFIFVNHRAGRTQGRPLSDSSLHTALDTLKRTFPDLASLHPHLLRHDWNYRFSRTVDEEHWSFKDERETREMLMGWSDGSSMSQLYNRRRIQEKANDIGLKVATDTRRSE